MVADFLKGLWTKVQDLGLFIYNWITVLVGSVVAADQVIDILNQFQVIDYSPFLTSAQAAAVVSTIAVLKGLAAIGQAFSRRGR